MSENDGWEAVAEVLREMEAGAELVAIITANRNGRVICYGRYIKSDRIFSVLNLRTGQTLVNRNKQSFEWESGDFFFTPLSTFEPEADSDKWVAIIGIRDDATAIEHRAHLARHCAPV